MSTLHTYTTARGDVHRVAAWTRDEIFAGVRLLLDQAEDRLPGRDAHVVVKPNLNNDLVSLTGNSVDLRVLAAVLEVLKERGYTRLTVADGSNVGIERRGIDTFARLRVDKLCDRYGANLVNLNRDDSHQVVLAAGAHPQVARTVLESDFLLSIPKIKTHVEAGLSCAMKNWVGIARGQDKRHMHYDLGRNIFAINEVVLPDLILVDGIVGMEGNGPGDGDPFRFGQLMLSTDAFLNDAVVCRLVGLAPTEIPYLKHAIAAGRLGSELLEEITATVPMLRQIQRPPPRTRVAEIADSRKLLWLKKAVRPITQHNAVAELAYKAKIIQDVYALEDDSVSSVRRDPSACGTCEKCTDYCPTGLSVDEIGVETGTDKCIGCLYCWWICPNDALTPDGPLGHLERQVERYKSVIEQL